MESKRKEKRNNKQEIVSVEAIIMQIIMIVICSYSRNDNNDNDNFQLVKSNLNKE